MNIGQMAERIGRRYEGSGQRATALARGFESRSVPRIHESGGSKSDGSGMARDVAATELPGRPMPRGAYSASDWPLAFAFKEQSQ